MRKTYALFISLIILFASCKKDSPVAGKHYIGYWHHISTLTLEFENDSIVNATESSSEFVGRFTDKATGYYTWNDSTIVIYLTEGSDENVYLNDFPIIDTFVANNDFSELTEYLNPNNKTATSHPCTLKKYRPWFIGQLLLFVVILIPVTIFLKRKIKR
jgi:hypothetical protein